MECAEQFRDGHYFGCIALTQTLVEAVIRHVWQIKLKKKPNQEGSLEKNLAALHKKKSISDDWKTKLDQMWSERHSFHHLRPSVKSDQKQLEETARSTLKLLNDLEQEFFSFDVNEGIIVPHHPEYWISQAVDVYLVIRQTDELSGQQVIRWMNVTRYLKTRK